VCYCVLAVDNRGYGDKENYHVTNCNTQT